MRSPLIYDRVVISTGQFLSGFVAGGVLLWMALVPAVFERLAVAVRNAVESVGSPPGITHAGTIRAPRCWLAGLGLTLMIISSAGYVALS